MGLLPGNLSKRSWGPQNKKLYGLFCFCLAASLVIAACSAQNNAPIATITLAPTEHASLRGVGDTLYIVDPQAPDILNPHLSASLKNLEPSRIVYEPLASFDNDGNIVLFLAAEIPTQENGGIASDGKSVTWKLRRDVFWSDGEPFTAEDVLFTYQYITNPEVRAATSSVYSTVKNVEIIDDFTVKVNFKVATNAWYVPFMSSGGLILPRHIHEAYNGANASQAEANFLPVGTGPYRVVEPGIKTQEVLLLGSQLISTKKIVFEPNPYYRHPDKPYFKRIEWQGGGTSLEAARRLFVDGDIDLAYEMNQLEQKTLDGLQKSGKGRLEILFGSVITHILLNQTDPNTEYNGERSSIKIPHPILSDKRIRQAIAYAIDRQAIAALHGSRGNLVKNILITPPLVNSPNLSNAYNYDPDKARQLLDEVGWKDTNNDGVRDKDGKKLELVFQTPTDTLYQRVQQVVRQNLGAVGIAVQIKLIDSLVMFGPGANNPDSFLRFNADLMGFDISMYGPDPADFLVYWTCDLIPQKANNWASGNLNVERWCNPEYDALSSQAFLELDSEKRRLLFIEMNDMLIENVVMIPLVNKADVLGVNVSIEGINLTPWDYYTWNIADWRRITP